jgi:hypothetical protein
MPQKPDSERAAGRVSPTATEGQSRSTNVWRLLEGNPEFREGMAQAQGEHERGEFKPFVSRGRRKS